MALNTIGEVREKGTQNKSAGLCLKLLARARDGGLRQCPFALGARWQVTGARGWG